MASLPGDAHACPVWVNAQALKKQIQTTYWVDTGNELKYENCTKSTLRFGFTKPYQKNILVFKITSQTERLQGLGHFIRA